MSSGYGEQTPREKLKKNLRQYIGDVYATEGTLDSKNYILERVSSFLRQLYNKGLLEDYTFSVETNIKDENVESILKGGSSTYWVNFSFKFPYQKEYIEESITIYVIKRINGDLMFNKKTQLGGLINCPAGSISSDGKSIGQDFSVVESNTNSSRSQDFTGVTNNKK